MNLLLVFLGLYCLCAALSLAGLLLAIRAAEFAIENQLKLTMSEDEIRRFRVETNKGVLALVARALCRPWTFIFMIAAFTGGFLRAFRDIFGGVKR